MGLFDALFRQNYTKYEYRGDRYMKAGDFGAAKLEYEKAMAILLNQSGHHPDYHRERVANKLENSREGLAVQHKETALNLFDSRCFSDAEEWLNLASELTKSRDLAHQIEDLRTRIRDARLDRSDEIFYDGDPETEIPEDQTDGDYFIVLCGALPEKDQEAYLGYGEAFEKGYVALNQMDFKSAAEWLSEAMKEHGDHITHAHLELATAYLNLGRMKDALELLEQFLGFDPESIRAYELMCDIFWERRDYAGALKMLAHAPDSIKSAVALNILLGETLRRAGEWSKAETLYLDFMALNGWNKHIAAALAGTYETAGNDTKALDLYGKIISDCQGCGNKVDPYIKRRFAELSYGLGHYSENLNELYLSLCQEDPAHRAVYYERISDVYSRIGHPEEAERFRLFSEKLKKNKSGS